MLSLPKALLISFLVGFASLSLEITWYSIFSFSFGGGIVGTFGFILSLILTGIALGAFFGFKICQQKKYKWDHFIRAVALLAGFLAYLFIPLFSNISVISAVMGFVFSIGYTVSIFAVMGSLFPVLCEAVEAKEGHSAGRITSWIYGANIAGATLGPIITSWVLLEIFSPNSLVVMVALVFWSIFLFCLPSDKAILWQGLVKHQKVCILGLLCILAVSFFDQDAMQKVFLKENFYKRNAFAFFKSNKHGIVHSVTVNPKWTTSFSTALGGDYVFGGGIYDGRVNIDPVVDSNQIQRVFFISALHPNPKRVLSIGLSTGSWASVLLGNPATTELTMLDIQPAYTDLIRYYNVSSSILKDDRATLNIDDGRRWLRQNPQEKFDLIVANTTFHFRENATNLTSIEFMELIKKQLKPGGMVNINSTLCTNIFTTMTRVFPYVIMNGNHIIGAMANVETPKEDIKRRLAKFSNNGKPFFAPEKKDDLLALDKIAGRNTKNQAKSALATDALVTDNNMFCEYKALHPWLRLVRGFRVY